MSVIFGTSISAETVEHLASVKVEMQPAATNLGLDESLFEDCAVPAAGSRVKNYI